MTSRNQLTPWSPPTAPTRSPSTCSPAQEARDLLGRRLGAGRVAAEPEAVEEIIAACARLPLALALVAARAATTPTFPLAPLAAELPPPPAERVGWTLATSRPPTCGPCSPGPTHPHPGAARLFRLLGLHPGPDLSAAAGGQPRRRCPG